jgi:hypothetical protein
VRSSSPDAYTIACTGHPKASKVTTITMSSVGLRSPSNIVARLATYGLFTVLTTMTLPLAIMDPDVALSFLASCGTRRIRAKLC